MYAPSATDAPASFLPVQVIAPELFAVTVHERTTVEPLRIFTPPVRGSVDDHFSAVESAEPSPLGEIAVGLALVDSVGLVVSMRMPKASSWAARMSVCDGFE